MTLTADNYDRYMSDDLFDLDMYEMREVEPEGYTSGLGTSVMLGAEYAFAGPQSSYNFFLGIGIGIGKRTER